MIDHINELCYNWHECEVRLGAISETLQEIDESTKTEFVPAKSKKNHSIFQILFTH